MGNYKLYEDVELWEEYLSLIKEMSDTRDIACTTLYGLDCRRSEIHEKMNEYYRNRIGDYAGGFNPDNLKLYTDNLDKLTAFIDTLDYKGKIHEKIARFFRLQIGQVVLSGATRTELYLGQNKHLLEDGNKND
ncbi:MAG: hypothetical protein LBP83_03510 [Dysgonamonadaceae bacterium]|jgi:hypothetical protein|nr:hypothetical protein [Dysgonamonadaceae bacterium]